MALPQLVSPDVTVLPVAGGVLIGVLIADLKCTHVIERAPDVAGSPGSFARIGRLPGGRREFLDLTGNIGDLYWYRAKARRIGFIDSGYSDDVQASPIQEYNADIKVPPYPQTSFVVSDVVGAPEKAAVEIRAWPVHADNLTRYAVLADADLVPPVSLTSADWTDYAGVFQVTRDTANAKKVAAFTELGGQVGDVALVEIAKDRKPEILSINLFINAGSVIASIQANGDSGSVKVAASTSAFPNLAAVQAETEVDGRNILTAELLNVKYGDTVFVSAVAYSRAAAAGVEGPLAQAKVDYLPEVVINPEGGENVVINGDFESGFAFWGINNTPNWELDTSTPIVGATSLNLTPTVADNALARQVFYAKNTDDNPQIVGTRILVKVEPGEIWRFSAIARWVSGASFHIRVTKYDEDKASISSENVVTWTSSDTANTERNAKWEVPAGTYYFSLGLFQTNGSIGSSFFDEIRALRVKKAINIDDDVVEDTGNLNEDVRIEEGGGGQAVARHVETHDSGDDADGEVPVTWDEVYQGIPVVAIAAIYVDVVDGEKMRIQGIDITTSGATIEAKRVTPGVLTGQVDDFPTTNFINAVDETTEANLDPAVASAGKYTVSFDVEVEAIADPGHTFWQQMTLAIDTDDGGGWIERWSKSYSISAFDASIETLILDDQRQLIVVSGLGLNDDIRLRIKAEASSGTGAGTYHAHGHNLPTDGDTFNGVVYDSTSGDTENSIIPDDGDNVRIVAVERQ